MMMSFKAAVIGTQGAQLQVRGYMLKALFVGIVKLPDVCAGQVLELNLAS